MRIFWLCYSLVLIAITTLFIMRALSFFELAEKGLKKHRRANSSTVKTEIQVKMYEAKVNGWCWIGAAFLSLYSSIDCLLNIVQGVGF